MQTSMKRALVSATATLALVTTSLFAGPAALAAEGEGNANETTSTAATSAEANPAEAGGREAHVAEGNATGANGAESDAKQQCEPVPGENIMAAGTLKWGLHDGFNAYIQRGEHPGTITPTDVAWADNVFTFTGTEGNFSTSTHEGVFKFAGSIHYSKYNGRLDLTFSNFVLKVKGRSVTINADVMGKDMAGAAFTKKDLVLGNVDFKKHTHEGKKTLFRDLPVVFTADGAAVFGGAYSEGDKMAALTGELTLEPKQHCVEDSNNGGGNAGAGAGTGDGAHNGAANTDDEHKDGAGTAEEPKGNADATKPVTEPNSTKTDSDKGASKAPVKGNAKMTNPKAGQNVALAKTGSSAGLLVALAVAAMALGVLLRRRA